MISHLPIYFLMRNAIKDVLRCREGTGIPIETKVNYILQAVNYLLLIYRYRILS
jgi:hypothetical protein